MKRLFILTTLLLSFPVFAEDDYYPDLPLAEQVDAAISNYIIVRNAKSFLQIEKNNQRKWESGSYEFNLKAGKSRREIFSPGVNDALKLNEWDVALERPFRLPNKAFIDSDIGEESVKRAQHALGDAKHEAARLLMHYWFNWLRAQTQVVQWQQQIDILTQQVQTTEMRLKAGDAPRMELTQANAALAQASVSLQQARLHADLAAVELIHEFPGIDLPPMPIALEPQPIPDDLATWKSSLLAENHELKMAESEVVVRSLLAKRNRADRLPDPTIGIRYSNEMGGNEKVSGIYVSIPLSYTVRSANAASAEYEAQIATDKLSTLRQRIEGTIKSKFMQATNSYQIWLKAADASTSIRESSSLVARAYRLGERSLTDTLTASRLALESALSESIARLDANEAHYQLLLDSHQLWIADESQDGEK